ncbi:DinB family protein [Adhaeribacter swui]|uniref:DinB family protein n=1 Tax=Adhaeribacter swui TaxID=2086471 RepID=A0A7G7GD60_9BACT|nr:DinB family protein [Adhaeribacter swui]QNF35094.1 DinB family protein [Adhaeribacter swui]
MGQKPQTLTFIPELTLNPMIAKAPLNEVAVFAQRYLVQIPEGDIIQRLQQQAAELKTILTNLPDEKLNYAYGPDKWSIKELFGHMVDTERILAYRALCIARGDQQTLPGFDENEYVNHAFFKEREFASLWQEYEWQRLSNITLFSSFNQQTLLREGMANNSPVTVRGLITIIAAHEFHHMQILKNRYLTE